jgi:dihydroflavonol-4-reductase
VRVRVFVTGATGFVGTHVVAALHGRGHSVTCLIRDPQKAERVFTSPLPACIRGDLDDPQTLRDGCADADAVVHLAGLTAARSRAELFAVNTGGTRALADAAQAADGTLQRFIYVSSLAAAGPAPNGGALTGTEEARPVSDYGRSKLGGEEPVRRLPMAWTILRPPAVYGPRDREFLRLFHVAGRGVTPIFGDGSERLSMVFAADLADAIVACVDGAAATGIYYPAHREITTTRTLVAGIAAALGARSRVIAIPRAVVRPLFWLAGTAARAAGRTTLLSIDKANEILAGDWTCTPARLESATGWEARTDLAAGLRQTAEWYRAAGWL